MTFAIAPIEQALAHSSYGAKEYVPTDVYRPTSLRAPYESWLRSSLFAMPCGLALWRHDRSAEAAF